jgi:hypothetical protein
MKQAAIKAEKIAIAVRASNARGAEVKERGWMA